MSILSLDNYLREFFQQEKKFLLNTYPGLTLHRLKQDIKLHAFLNGVDSEELFDFPYQPYRTNPLTIFFDKLKIGMPLEYITGYAYFYRSLFKVNSDVLIPRSETEILVELASLEIKKNFKNRVCRIADIGTGTGAIALSLMYEEAATLEIVATDLSSKALRVAKENFFNLKFSIPSKHTLLFVNTDRMEGLTGSFDLILSNPPYIKKVLDAPGVHDQVKSFEPHLALFLLDSEYDSWFKDFFKTIFNKLSDSGVSLVEGHEDHLENLAIIARGIGFSEVLVIKDYTQRNRFLRLKK
ncbi:MAG: peptide chain release factor N(5)-glutamine methyltransferase [Bacteriovoracaceae bacterium]|nr:peptide chain release factor N(5)-glutamine methyltransferase [Bacteriovoracaceae bacterium]